jgi:hypothetical protein
MTKTRISLAVMDALEEPVVALEADPSGQVTGSILFSIRCSMEHHGVTRHVQLESWSSASYGESWNGWLIRATDAIRQV